MSVNPVKLTSELYQYLVDHSLREPLILKELREETQASFSTYKMQSSPEQMQFLALLVHLLQAERTIDIGTFTGYSALAIALALPSSGQVITCDVDEKTTALAKRYWEKAKVSSKIELRLGPAMDTLDQWLAQKERRFFDFAYIDADKSNMIHYYEKILALLRPGGLIAIDNVLWDGRVVDSTNKEESTKAIRAFNEKLYRDERVDVSIIPFADGVSLARKKLLLV